MRKPDPGELVAVGLVGAALAADVLLVRRDCHTISTCVRRGVIARLVVAYLALHLLTTIPHDPLSWLGGKVGQRLPPPPTWSGGGGCSP